MLRRTQKQLPDLGIRYYTLQLYVFVDMYSYCDIHGKEDADNENMSPYYKVDLIKHKHGFNIIDTALLCHHTANIKCQTALASLLKLIQKDGTSGTMQSISDNLKQTSRSTVKNCRIKHFAIYIKQISKDQLKRLAY